jgi:hypothetical protein
MMASLLTEIRVWYHKNTLVLVHNGSIFNIHTLVLILIMSKTINNSRYKFDYSAGAKVCC